MFSKKLSKKVQHHPKAPALPFEKRETLQSLSLFFTIINRHQAQYYVKAYQDVGCSLSMIMYAHSMPPVEILQLLGADETKKDIIMTVTRTEYIPQLKKIAEERFKISKISKGIAFAIPIDAVSGIAIYKFLADHNKEVRTNGNAVTK